MQALVTPQWLRDHRNDERIVIADCRFALSASEQGAEEYATDHIPGALYFHLNRDLSGPKQEHGGRHPLPDPAALAALFSQAGIDEHTTVIAYDDQEMAMAGRLWWLLRYLGHDRVAVLDGGYAAWKKAGYEVTAEVPTPQARTFVPQLRPDMLVSVEGVKNREPEAVLLDSRAGERYRGEQEPLDPKAGHIPGARHFFYKDNLQADMTMLPAEQLRNRIAGFAEQEIIVYCGSGVTACSNLLALHQAGRTDAKLYAGSWSDWVSYSENPVATGEE
ncbi:sulfurtransferase [Brevibacillus parabrevis]|uniref:Thiosulfate sulfurtransferase n=1 Tax=Brevibacillus parabrevis TaxID=54914 RepID=A0A4Y3PHT4_BREPA|nr:sulfurtransferase [Brevibacillus parabrevis]MBU8711908.1 sulfurtransferase [Brevibacillus parabrevis]RNB93561.1 sulfurtransferase [Brevibacillus parabrevis]WDV97442.1 sulfurtransferase [Brevibacillus parabrevis]GEB31506.1 thiosulfate sulfurtransferase [Brevibacillus parabrevis]